MEKEENYIDRMVSNTLARFNRSKLKTVRDNLGLNPKDGKYCISGDLGYMSLRLFYCGAEVRQYDNGKVFVYFDYDDRVGAWGGYTRRYEVKDLDVFKSPRWKSIIKSEGVKTSPDVIMI